MTIEERAEEFVAQFENIQSDSDVDKSARCALHFGYAEGMRDAMSWINTEEQMPEELKSVLTMSVYEGQNIYAVDFVKEGRFTRMPKPVKWRPIEFE